MQGERASVYKSIFLNPMVWVGVILTLFTLQNEDEKSAFELFLEPVVYRNLAIGCAVYVALFDRHYTKNMEHFDFAETFLAFVQAMLTVLLTWGVTLGFIVNYHMGGEKYSEVLAAKYRNAQKESRERAVVPAQDDMETTVQIPSEEVKDALGGVELEANKSYKITPQSDGSFVVEVVDN